MSDNIHRKLCAIAPRVHYVQKDATNAFHKYRYASAEKVLGKVSEELAAAGISVQSEVEILAHTPSLDSVITKVTLTLTDADTGEVVAFEGTGQGSDKGDKATMKAQTAATKYALASGFLISWGDDPEADPEVDRRAAAAWDGDALAQVKDALQACGTIEDVNAYARHVASLVPPASLRVKIQEMFNDRRKSLAV